jgi:hypothetical protein
LIDAIDDYITISNKNPKPFLWTKTAKQILEISTASLFSYEASPAPDGQKSRSAPQEKTM